jgi:hypothetical protein
MILEKVEAFFVLDLQFPSWGPVTSGSDPVRLQQQVFPRVSDLDPHGSALI